MQIIFMRHATRASSFDSDCSLNTVGLSQAASASSQLVPHGSLPVPTDLFCSPKLRARQTLMPLAETLGLELKADARLDERSSHESRSLFDARIRDFLASLSFSMTPPKKQDQTQASGHSAKTVLICSHMDWLEAVLLLLPSHLSDHELSQPWAAGEYRIFETDPNGIWKLLGQGVLQAV